MKNILRLIASGFAAAFFAIAAQAADLAPGAFSAGTVKGDVSYKTAGSADYVALTAGTSLPQGATVKTGVESSVIIVFSNGATAAITPESEVEITKFEQELFSGPISVDAEPSVSSTEIKVVTGGVINKVAKLKKGSAYTVNSPVGAAGVRGTTFSVFYNAATKSLVVRVVTGSVAVTTRSAEGGTTETVVTTEQQFTATSTGAGEAVTVDLSALPADAVQEIINVIEQVTGQTVTETTTPGVIVIPDPTQLSPQ